MTLSLSIGPIAALVAGILILILPRLLNYIIALYLIVVGLIGLFGNPISGARASLTGAPAAPVQQMAPQPVGQPVEI